MSAPITVDNNKLARSGVDATTRPSPSSGPEKSEVVPTTDIEHAAVDNDPRLWSARRKVGLYIYLAWTGSELCILPSARY